MARESKEQRTRGRCMSGLCYLGGLTAGQWWWDWGVGLFLGQEKSEEHYLESGTLTWNKNESREPTAH